MESVPKTYQVQILANKLTNDQKRLLQFTKNSKIIDNQLCWDFKKHRFGDTEAQLLMMIAKNKVKPVVKELRLSKNTGSNKRPAIIKQITHLTFFHLTMLDVGSNQITSIQALTYVNTPSLARLNLYNNQITCIKSIRKCSFPDLIYLSLLSNPDIPELGFLSEFNMKEMQWLWLEHKEKKSVADQSLDWIFRVNCKASTFYQMIIKSPNRIEIPVIVYNSISKKFPSLSIDLHLA